MMAINISTSFAQQTGNANAIYSGLSWYDQNGNVVLAHGAGIIKDNEKYYLFGELTPIRVMPYTLNVSGERPKWFDRKKLIMVALQTTSTWIN